jgi:methylenetetrahydrofolate reductase (NADPH)
VLQVRQFERHGMRRLGLAAHPEGSPDIPPAALSRALAEKNAYAARSDIAFELMTQFCFDAAVITEWERQVRAAGNRLPVAVGLAGLASVTTLIKHARSCGVGNSIGLLLKHASKLRQLASAVDPSGMVLDLARAKQADHACAIARLHFFPFGSFAATARFARALAEGDFTIEKDLRRIRVHQ